MSSGQVITKELESLINVPYGPEEYEIEKSMIKKFAEAVGDQNPRWKEEAPPTFPAVLAPMQLLQKLFSTDISSLKRLLNGTSELEYIQPIKAGDVISVTGTLTRLRQVEGKEGLTLFMFTEVIYTNQRGEVVVKGKNTYVKY